ncbi:MAG: type transport system ATP-binding protein [Archaeoglobi archaeon]|nr:type transport system ATP-binding protein [Archaeoglobi archaeon]MDK2781470.1 type transport system ATP-binding protein [Archaeoglobi archaeon]
MIRTVNLTKEYDGIRAVDSLNLEVRKGEVFGFLGPNGAGKSTTILMLGAMIEPTSGTCYIGDFEVTRNPLEVKKITGYLPERPGFYEHLDAEGNLDYFARFYSMSEEERRRRIKEVLEIVGLEDARRKKVGEFSRGMIQRLALAQALLNDPEVLLLDEPTSGIDPQGALEFRRIIKELEREGKTILFSSHILSEVREVCGRIGIISKGRLVAVGTPDEIRRQMGEENYRIIVEPLPENLKLEHEDILRIERDGSRAVIEAKSDIREFISGVLMENRVKLRELRLEMPSLEELFMKVIYESEVDENAPGS